MNVNCAKCGKLNPLGTVFCHGCGGRIEVTAGQVLGSVAETERHLRERTIYHWGRSALNLCGFALFAALALRYGMVPAVPLAELPATPPQVLFPIDNLAWADGAGPAAPGTPAKPGAAVVAAEEKPPPMPTIAVPKRLEWRRQQGPFILSSMGLDMARLAAMQQEVVAAQKPDGSFAGGDPLAATALGTLALHALPGKPPVDAAAARGLTALLAKVADLSAATPLSRSLVIMALVDAEALPESVRVAFGIRLVDGSVGTWQALALPLYAPKSRPSELAGLRAALKEPLWQAFLTINDASSQVGVDARLLFSENAKSLLRGEDRLVWAHLAWHHPLAPRDLADTLKAWSAAAPCAVDPALATVAGTFAPAAVALLTVTSPARLPPVLLTR